MTTQRPRPSAIGPIDTKIGMINLKNEHCRQRHRLDIMIDTNLHKNTVKRILNTSTWGYIIYPKTDYYCPNTLTQVVNHTMSVPPQKIVTFHFAESTESSKIAAESSKFILEIRKRAWAMHWQMGAIDKECSPIVIWSFPHVRKVYGPYTFSKVERRNTLIGHFRMELLMSMIDQGHTVPQ